MPAGPAFSCAVPGERNCMPVPSGSQDGVVAPGARQRFQLGIEGEGPGVLQCLRPQGLNPPGAGQGIQHDGVEDHHIDALRRAAGVAVPGGADQRNVRLRLRPPVLDQLLIVPGSGR